MKQTLKLELEEAKIMIEAAKKKSEEINVLETIAITDDGGNLIALERMNGARITGPEISIAKAYTAAGHKRSTHLFNKEPNGPALPGNEAFGINQMLPGKFAIFVGGFPIVANGEVVGGIGVSGGNGEQDTAVGTAALQALQESLKDQGIEIITDADIKK
ncbi:GlcG/HbpS family heme-binding protein [Schinkia azotoformans]|uniref:GlcG/HbpS family heme-binding protein n=1 Tax=Schinkia azotoformans TaxID=1454 RepID=UPI002DB858B2|nr:heme-binding protein [Schinkia azotoformans]MEC1694390.1 heme-binding protein [Schinkia azotoformans]MEC1714429.1 heme-binding protein [Schinkia azotoformans]MEC1723201.1 heme-binding protein [Schinkia azotoformans]MEC1740476.1 heme-binding protein [Schinkia azotoformans]MEC1744967.1 heme-binding protein [Schinkia azotoformans]